MNFLRQLLAALLLALAGSGVRAQEAIPIAEANRIFTTPGTSERFVKFSGTVIQSVPHGGYVFIQEGHTGIQVNVPDGTPVPALRDRIEVEARMKFVVANGDTAAEATTVRVIGHGELPEPLRMKLADIRAGKANRQAVQAEGVVVHAFHISLRYFTAWWLLMSDDDGVCLGGVDSYPPDWNPTELIGKKIRFLGVGMPGSEFILRCTSPEDLTVLGPAEGTKALAPLTTAVAVRDYGVENARKRQPPVMVRGVCTFAPLDKQRFFIQSETGPLEVKCRPDLCPKRGDEVAVAGIISAGSGATYVIGWDVDILASGKEPPPPFKWNLDLIEHNDKWGIWVETEGVVIQAQTNRKAGTTQFYIVDNANWMRVYVTAPPPEPPGGWWNARIRVRGALVHDGRLIVWSNGGKDFEVVKPGVAAPFDVPLTTAAALRTAPLSASRVRVKGTVTDFREGWIYLRDGTGALRSDTATQFEPDSIYSVLPGDTRWPPGGVKPGDEVELAGSPMEPSGGLRYSTIRITGSGKAPPAKMVKLAAAADGTAANDLVTLRGRLVNYTSGFVAGLSTKKRWREALHLEEGKAALEVIFEDAGNEGAFAKFRPGDLIEATGIVRYDGGTPAFSLRIRTMDDIRTLGPDPEVVRARLIRVIIICAIALAAALAWVLFTRRTVAARTAELAAANRQLDEALVHERELGELKMRFVSLVSHEFRTPLGVTMSAVELLRSYMARLSDEKKTELLDDIHHSTLRMAAMMEQMLLLGRVEAGKITLHSTPLNLREVCEKLLDEMLSATVRKCRIEFTGEGDLSGAAGDESLIRHILTNLISNAAKYSPAGGLVEFATRQEGDTALFTVRDHGIGIPAADQARLFEAFHRAGNVGEIPGTGLGLLIVKRCVELHLGAISFDSQEGIGTTFTVRLPLFGSAGAK